MNLHLGKFIHTETGRIMMSIILGLGIASLFRTVCKGDNCIHFVAAPIEKIKEKVFNLGNGKCVNYSPVPSKCNASKKIIEFA
jgi:hypothetical protein